MDKARPGDTIVVKGICEENVFVRTDGIHLKALGASIIGQSTAPAITVTGRNVRVTGFEISSDGSGISVTDGGSATIGGPDSSDRNTIKVTKRDFPPVSGTGISVSNKSHAVIENNKIGEIGNGGSIEGNGITVIDLSSARIIGNEINAPARHGIVVIFSSVLTEGNDINGPGRNGFLVNNSSIEIVDDTIDGSTNIAVALSRSNGVLDGVTITNSGSPRLSIFNGSSANILETTITGPGTGPGSAGTGVNVGSSSSARFAKTTITGNDTGIFVFWRSAVDFIRARGSSSGNSNRINDNAGVGVSISSSDVAFSNSVGDEIKRNGGFGILCVRFGALTVLRDLDISDNNGSGAEVSTGSATDSSLFDPVFPRLPTGDVTTP